jgi:peptidoglycan hydrolase-like protein with peptidoglycan-binding domain
MAAPVHHAATAAHKQGTGTHKKKPKSKRLRGQQAIESSRVTEIQQALIREHYLTGEANGKWDATTIAAMQKYQADQGWQTKLMPDSRALKKLGLGPDYSNAINAKDSSFGAPPPASTIPADQAAGFATAAGVNR